MKLKLLSENMTDFYTGKLKFAVGEITKCPDWKDVDEIGNGIHYSESLATMLENTSHKGVGYLVEVEPVGKEVRIRNKYKAEAVLVNRVLAIPEWLETLSPDDPNLWNRRLRAAKLGLETLSPDDPNLWNRLLRTAKLGLETLSPDDPDEWNRRLRAAKVGLETLSPDDPNLWNRLLRTAKLGLETLSPDDPDWWNRLLRAAKVGLETLSPDDPDEWNRRLRAAKTDEWDNIFRCLQ